MHRQRIRPNWACSRTTSHADMRRLACISHTHHPITHLHPDDSRQPAFTTPPQNRQARNPAGHPDVAFLSFILRTCQDGGSGQNSRIHEPSKDRLSIQHCRSFTLCGYFFPGGGCSKRLWTSLLRALQGLWLRGVRLRARVSGESGVRKCRARGRGSAPRRPPSAESAACAATWNTKRRDTRIA